MPSFEIARPVLANPDLKRFLARVSHVGEEVLGNQNIDLVTPDHIRSSDLEQPSGRPMRPIGQPRLRILDDLRLPVFGLYAPRDSGLQTQFHNVASRISPKYASANKKAKDQRTDVYGNLKKLFNRYELDGDEEAGLGVRASAIVLRQPPEGSATELALALDPSELTSALFVEEHQICKEGIAAVKGGKRLVQPTDDFTLKVPFARLPEDMQPDERSKLINKLSGEMPIGLLLGAVDLPSVTR